MGWAAYIGRVEKKFTGGALRNLFALGACGLHRRVTYVYIPSCHHAAECAATVTGGCCMLVCI